MNDVINERRKSPRFALTVAATVSEPFNPSEMTGRLADISRTGCYVDTVHPLAPGMHVKIRLRVEDELFETLAKVIHVHAKRGMGLNWGTNPQDHNLEVLNRWLHPTSQAVGLATPLK
jgi:FKBP-type peptidyl-prolyl cis-trans isomerase 2